MQRKTKAQRKFERTEREAKESTCNNDSENEPEEVKKVAVVSKRKNQLEDIRKFMN